MKNLKEVQTRENPNDELYTPRNLSRQLISSIEGEFCDTDTFYDPFFGTGSFYNNLPNPTGLNEWSEINLGTDFYKQNNQFDWIASNPPFSQLTKMLEKTAMIARKGFAYIMPSYSLTVSRIKMLHDYGFTLTKITFFENPKDWQLGFQMMFVLFEKDAAGKYGTGMPFQVLTLDNSVQTTLI